LAITLRILQTILSTSLTAICVKCGRDATRTQRLINGEPAHYNSLIIMVGAQDIYEARCRNCHEVLGEPDSKAG